MASFKSLICSFVGTGDKLDLSWPKNTLQISSGPALTNASSDPFSTIWSVLVSGFALLSSARPPEGVEEHDFYFCVALLDHCYWIAGSVIGSLAGAALGFDTTGVDFAMTALFLVIAVGQWKAAGSHLPALLGAAATLVSLLVVGAEDMLLPALGIIVLVLTLLRPRLDESRPAQQARSQEVTP